MQSSGKLAGATADLQQAPRTPRAQPVHKHGPAAIVVDPGVVPAPIVVGVEGLVVEIAVLLAFPDGRCLRNTRKQLQGPTRGAADSPSK